MLEVSPQALSQAEKGRPMSVGRAAEWGSKLGCAKPLVEAALLDQLEAAGLKGAKVALVLALLALLGGCFTGPSSSTELDAGAEADLTVFGGGSDASEPDAAAEDPENPPPSLPGRPSRPVGDGDGDGDGDGWEPADAAVGDGDGDGDGDAPPPPQCPGDYACTTMVDPVGTACTDLATGRLPPCFGGDCPHVPGATCLNFQFTEGCWKPCEL